MTSCPYAMLASAATSTPVQTTMIRMIFSAKYT